jgi:hypothetical protein
MALKPRASAMILPQFPTRLRRYAAMAAVGGALALAAPLAAAQADSDGEAKASASDPLGEPLDTPLPRLGLMFDLGSVDGGMLSLVYRPSPWLRVYGGGGSNTAAPGLRLGAAVSPFQHLRELAFNLDGGHFFPGDVNGIFAAIGGSRFDNNRVLEHFDYNFVNLQAGWEIERAGLMFFVRGGVAFVWTQLPAEGVAQIRHLSPLIDRDGSVATFLPSIRIGLIGFL